MKIKQTAAILICALALCLSNAPAQEIEKSPTITVTGKAEVNVPPDEVIFSLDVKKLNLDLQISKKQNDEAVAKILEITRRFNLPPQNVKTDSISVAMRYESIRDAKRRVYDEDGDEIGNKIFKGYEVSKTVTVKLTDLTRFEDLFSEVLKSGVTEVDSVSFQTSQLREAKDKARELAMKAAREKAVAMTAAINQTVGKAIKITEDSESNSNYGLNANNNVPMNGIVSEAVNVATFAPGTIKIQAQVTVIFLLN